MGRKKLNIEKTRTRITKDDTDRIELVKLRESIKTKIGTITFLLDYYEKDNELNSDSLDDE